MWGIRELPTVAVLPVEFGTGWTSTIIIIIINFIGSLIENFMISYTNKQKRNKKVTEPNLKLKNKYIL